MIQQCKRRRLNPVGEVYVPPEILLEIMSYLKSKELCICFDVSQCWKSIIICQIIHKVNSQAIAMFFHTCSAGNQAFFSFHTEQYESYFNKAMKRATIRGRINIVKELFGRGTAFNDVYIDYACRYGHLKLVKYLCGKLRTHNPEFSSFIRAAIKGHSIHILKWIHRSYPTIQMWLYLHLARHYRCPEIYQWLETTSGCTWLICL